MLLPLYLMTVDSGAMAAPVPLYIGTYTSPNGSQGIYKATLDPETGKLSPAVLSAETNNPSFLAFSPDNTRLFAVQETGEGLANSYTVNADGTLMPVNTVSGAGNGPCHLTVSPDGTVLLTASYGGGTVASYRIKPDGSLSPRAAEFKNQGTGPNKSRQEKPHLHAVTFLDQKHAYAVDLGTDELLLFIADPTTGSLIKSDEARTPAGSGPRHITIHPNKKFAYVNGELDNTVQAYSIDPESKSLKLLQKLSTLPTDDPREVHSATAEIVIHPTGKWLYVSNRGHNSIAVYSVKSDGTLSLVEIKRLVLKNPRGMDISPSGSWLVVAGQDSNDLASYKVDPATGKLGDQASRIETSRPVCVLFRNKK